MQAETKLTKTISNVSNENKLASATTFKTHLF